MSALPRLPQPWFRAEAISLPIRSLTVADKYRDLREGERYVGPFVIPTFQRRPVWTQAQQVALIESLLAGYPIGAIIYNVSNGPCDGWLLDGQQRITAIDRYVHGALPVGGHRFTEVDIADRRNFLMRPVAAQESQIDDEETCRRVYEALSIGGTPHAADQYESQAPAG